MADLDSLDYSEWFTVIYWEAAPNEQYPNEEWDAGFYPDILTGTYNPYNPSYMWNWHSKHWIPVHQDPDSEYDRIITSSHMANGYEVQYGNNALYSGITKSSGTITGYQAYSYNGNQKGDVGVLVPVKAPPVYNPTNLVVEVYYPGDHVPVTITVYGQDDAVMGTSAGNNLLRTIPLNWAQDPYLIELEEIYCHPEYIGDNYYHWDNNYHRTIVHIDELGYTHMIDMTSFWYRIYYVTNGTGSWTFTDITPPVEPDYYLTCLSCDACVDINGKFHLAIQTTYTPPTPDVDGVGYYTNASGAWVWTQLLSVASDEDIYEVVITTDDNGYPHIAYWFHEDVGPVDTWMYMYWNGATWSTPIAICDATTYDYIGKHYRTLVVSGDGTRRLFFTVDHVARYKMWMFYSTGGAFNSVMLNDGTMYAISPMAIRTSSNTFELYYLRATSVSGTDEYMPSQMSGTFNPIYCGNDVVDLVTLAGMTPITTYVDIGPNFRWVRGANMDSSGRRYIPLYDDTYHAEKTGHLYSDDGITWDGIWNFADYNTTKYMEFTHITGNKLYGNVFFYNAQSYGGGSPGYYGEYTWGWNMGAVLVIDRIEIDYDTDQTDEVIFDGNFQDGSPQTPVELGNAHVLTDNVDDLGVFLIPHLIID